MKIAVFSDIHANFPALKNVLNEVETQDIIQVYCLGDLVGYGPHPNDVIETIRNRKIPTVMGNYDEGVGYERGDCGCAYVTDKEERDGQESINWTTDKVTMENKEYLRNLNREIKLELNGYKLLLVHGSPRRINEYLYEDRLEKSLVRILNSIEVDVLICGHTHIPYRRVVNDTLIINVGSVGKPKDGDRRACYALIDFGEALSINFRRVKYPVDKVSKEIVKLGLPKAFADALHIAGK